jgi:hypothetical protein
VARVAATRYRRRDVTTAGRGRGAIANLALAALALLVACALLETGMRLFVWLAPGSAALALSDSDAKRQQRWFAFHEFDAARGGVGVTAFEASAYDPLLGWVPKPNLVDYVHPALMGGRSPISTNSAGMRGRREFPREKPAGVERLVIVGDSFTFGIGERDDDVWPARLAALLDGWEVLNLGVYGYGTDQQYLMLRERGLAWKPDVVVFAAYMEGVLRNGMAFRDYAKPRFVLEGDRLVLTNVPVPSPAELLAHRGAPTKLRSYAFDFVRQRLRAVAPVDPSDVEVERVTRAIVGASFEASRAAGARFLLVLIPMSHAEPTSRRYEQAFTRWAGEFGFPVVNVREPLATAAKRTGTPMVAGHFTPAGSREVARVVHDTLVDLGWTR